MKKIFFKLICFLFITFCFSQCVMDNFYVIYLYNNSNYEIKCHFSDIDNINGFYPDTLIPQSNLYVRDIPPKTSGITEGGLPWEDKFSSGYFPRDTFSIFIFHSDTLTKYNWDDVRNKYMVLRRYDLSLEDLIKLDYMIPYPPDDKMKYMKMYPPYSE